MPMSAEEYKICDAEGKPVAEALATVYNASMDSIDASVTDKQGLLTITRDFSKLLIERKEFAPQLVARSEHRDDSGLLTK